MVDFPAAKTSGHISRKILAMGPYPVLLSHSTASVA